jgi:ribose 5-phosphate isomerase A
VNLKQQAAHEALKYVRSGLVLGLGSGSTAGCFLEMLGEQLRCGALRDIRGVPTSESVAARAHDLGIPLTSLAEHPRLDLAVDGADEVDPDLNLIKGLGRALLREKIVEIHAERFLVVVDESKRVERLGRGPLPVEIAPFGAETTVRWLGTLGCRAELWLEADGVPIVTDNDHYLARCWFSGGIADAHALARTLAERPGVIEHGLFLDMASAVIVAGLAGVQTLACRQKPSKSA